MERRYEEKLDNITIIMFKVSLYLNNMFNFSLLAESKKDKEKTIKEIIKVQKRSYKMIEKYKLHNDTPYADKQNVLDMIDYFFVNRGYSSAKEFIKVISPLVHKQKSGNSLNLDDNISSISSKKFYESNCWQEFLKQGLTDISVLDARKPLTQEKINAINNQYSKASQLNNNSNERTL